MCVKSLNVQLYERIDPSGSELPTELKVTVCRGTGFTGEKLMTAVGSSSGPTLTTVTSTIVELRMTAPADLPLAVTKTPYEPGAVPVGAVTFRIVNAEPPAVRVRVG
jgi:hypothetical protein